MGAGDATRTAGLFRSEGLGISRQMIRMEVWTKNIGFRVIEHIHDSQS